MMALTTFYRSIISDNSFGKRTPFLSFSVVTLSVLLVSFLGIKSLAIIPILIFAIFTIRFRLFPLCFLLATLPIAMYFFGGIYTIYNYSLVLLIMGLWFIRKMLGKERSFRYSRFMVYFAASFFIVMLLSALNNGLTRPEILSILRHMIYFPLVIVIYDLVEPRHTVPIIISITIPLLISSYFLFNVYIHISGLFDFLHLLRMKPGGIFKNANSFGARVLFAAPFWMALAVWGRNKLVKRVSMAISIILVLSILLTNTRSAMVGLFVGVVFYIILAKKLKYFIALISVMVVIFLSSQTLRTVISAGLRLDRGTSSRGLIWENTFDMISKNFWFGIGVGNYQSYNRQYIKTAWEISFTGGGMSHAHNEILNKVAEIGILGLFFMLALYYVPAKKGYTLMKKNLSLNDRAVVFGLMGILFSNFGRSFFEANTMLGAGGIYPPILYWITIIMIIKLAEQYTPGGNEFIMK